jgi:hypothetical protein
MNRHTERFIAWYDMETDGQRWKVLDLQHDDPATSSGKEELARCGNHEQAHSLAMELERGDEERHG